MRAEWRESYMRAEWRKSEGAFAFAIRSCNATLGYLHISLCHNHNTQKSPHDIDDKLIL